MSEISSFLNILKVMVVSLIVPLVASFIIVGGIYWIYKNIGFFSARANIFYNKTQFNLYNIAFFYSLILCIIGLINRHRFDNYFFENLLDASKSNPLKSITAIFANLHVFEFWVIGGGLFTLVVLVRYFQTFNTPRAKTFRKRRSEMWRATWLSFRSPSPLVNDNTIVSGATRSGKTSWIRRIIEALIEMFRPLILIDGKGDIGERSLYEGTVKLARKYDRPLFVIDQTNVKNSDPYNPFKRCKATEIKDMLQEMGDWSVNAAHYKELAGRYWQMMARYMIENDIPRNFRTLIKYSNPNELAEHIMKNNTLDGPEDEYISDNIRKTILDKYGVGGLSIHRAPYLKIMIESAEGVEKNTASFATIYEGEGRTMFGENEGFDIEDVLESKGVLIVLLNSMTYTDFSVSMGALVIQDFKNTMGRRMARKKSEKVTAIFEELGAYFSDSVVDLSARIGSLGGNVIYSVQGFSDMDVHDKNVRRQIVNNTNRFFTFRLNDPDDAVAIADVLGTIETTNETAQTEDNGIQESSTGMGTTKSEREYIFSPEIIKTLPVVRGIVAEKDNIYSKPYIFKVKYLELDDIEEPTKEERFNRREYGDWNSSKELQKDVLEA